MYPSTTLLSALVTLACLAAAGTASAQGADPVGPSARQTVWPGERWEVATPESRGMSGAALDAAAAYAEKSGGGSSCVVRNGFIVKEWGDPNRLADIKSGDEGHTWGRLSSGWPSTTAWSGSMTPRREA